MSFNLFISYFKRIVSDVGWAFMDDTRYTQNSRLVAEAKQSCYEYSRNPTRKHCFLCNGFISQK
ncbi:hypothetical protein [Prevotella fusca]